MKGEEEVQLKEQMGLRPEVLDLLKWDEKEQEEKPETLLTRRAIDTEKVEILYNLIQTKNGRGKKDYICTGSI